MARAALRRLQRRSWPGWPIGRGVPRGGRSGTEIVIRWQMSPTNLRLQNRHTGEVLEIWREKRGGELLYRLRGTLPAHRQGPPLHIHHVEDEEGLIIAGTLSAEVDGKQLTFGPGETVRLPRGVPHRWWNDGDQPLIFEGYTRPAVDLDRYLQAVFEVVN